MKTDDNRRPGLTGRQKLELSLCVDAEDAVDRDDYAGLVAARAATARYTRAGSWRPTTTATSST